MASASKSTSTSSKPETKLVKELADILDTSGLAEIEYETEAVSIRLSRVTGAMPVAAVAPPVAAPAAAPGAPAAASTAAWPESTAASRPAEAAAPEAEAAGPSAHASCGGGTGPPALLAAPTADAPRFRGAARAGVPARAGPQSRRG